MTVSINQVQEATRMLGRYCLQEKLSEVWGKLEFENVSLTVMVKLECPEIEERCAKLLKFER